MISAYYIKNQLEHIRGMNVVIEANTSLNEKYNILTDRSVPEGVLPKLQYLGVGIGGIGTDIKLGYHKYIHGALYDQIPFVCRELSSDLSSLEAVNYRFRVVKNINDTDYVFYYLKHIESIADSINIKKITKHPDNISGGVIDRFDTNNAEILNPTPDETTGVVDPSKTEYYIVECKIPISLNQEEKAEMINAYQILKESSNIPNISEMCLFTGLDTTLESGFLEAYAVRSGVFYAVPIELQPLLSTPGVTQRYIDIGGMRLQ